MAPELSNLTRTLPDESIDLSDHSRQQSIAAESHAKYRTQYANFEEVKNLIESSKPMRRPNRAHSQNEGRQGIDDIAPSGEALDRLVDRFPAPKEWGDEWTK